MAGTPARSDPPEHTIVLSVDEKSQIQALDRTQPGLPMKKVKKGRAGTMTHGDKRHAAFTRFRNVVNREAPARKSVHAILDDQKVL